MREVPEWGLGELVSRFMQRIIGTSCVQSGQSSRMAGSFEYIMTKVGRKSRSHASFVWYQDQEGRVGDQTMAWDTEASSEVV